MISTNQPILPEDLSTTLWASVASHAGKVSNQYSENVLTVDFKGCSGVDDATPRPRRAYVDWVPATDVKIIGLVFETSGTGLASPGTVVVSVSTAAQGQIIYEFGPVSNGVTTRTAETAQFVAKQTVIGGGDLVEIAFENADFGAAELTKCKVHLVYTQQWSRQ